MGKRVRERDRNPLARIGHWPAAHQQLRLIWQNILGVHTVSVWVDWHIDTLWHTKGQKQIQFQHMTSQAKSSQAKQSSSIPRLSLLWPHCGCGLCCKPFYRQIDFCLKCHKHAQTAATTETITAAATITITATVATISTTTAAADERLGKAGKITITRMDACCECISWRTDTVITQLKKWLTWLMCALGNGIA